MTLEARHLCGIELEDVLEQRNEQREKTTERKRDGDTVEKRRKRQLEGEPERGRKAEDTKKAGLKGAEMKAEK